MKKGNIKLFLFILGMVIVWGVLYWTFIATDL